MGATENTKIRLDASEYLFDDLSPKAQALWKELVFCDGMIKQFEAQKALLNRARNGYIEDIKIETIEKISGVDFKSLLSDD